MKGKRKKIALLIFCSLFAIGFLFLTLHWIFNDYYLGVVSHGKMQYEPNLFAYLRSPSAVASKYGMKAGYPPLRALAETIIFSIAFFCFTYFSIRIYFKNFTK